MMLKVNDVYSTARRFHYTTKYGTVSKPTSFERPMGSVDSCSVGRDSLGIPCLENLHVL